jgi:hypothetical protein
MKFLALPTWSITAAIIPFLPADHPYKNKKVTLKEWANARTELCKFFDFFFWMQIIIFVILIQAVLK